MNNTDKLGHESVGKLMMSLSVPAIAGQIVNMLYNIVDRIYIGHMPRVGGIALTGVGITFPIIMLITAFSSLIGMGGAPRAAIKLGENRKNEAENILGNCITALLLVSVVLTAVFLYFGESLLWFFGASGETISYALDYLNVYVIGTVFVQLSLGLNPFITTQGHAKTSMFTVVIGAVVNIILDPVFIFTLDMGVKGAALATIISQAVSAVWVTMFLTSKKSVLKIRKCNMKLDNKIMTPVLFLGMSPFIMGSTDSLLNITFNTSLQKYGGDMAVGAMTIMGSLKQILYLPVVGLTQGTQPIISYNYGAKNNHRVRKAIKILLVSSMSYAIIFWLLMMLAPRTFVSVFNKEDPQLIELTVWAMRIFMSSAFLIAAQIACQQTFIAIGQAKISVFLALLRKMVLLIPSILILPVFFADKTFAVFLAEPVSDVIAVTVTVSLFAIRYKQLLTD